MACGPRCAHGCASEARAMTLDRRRFLVLGTAAAAGASPALAAALAARRVRRRRLAQFGLRPGSGEDQSRAFQRAIDETARDRTPLAIAPGSYRVGNLRLPANAQLVGVRGATKLILSDSASLLSRRRRGARHAVRPRARRPAAPPARAARPPAFRQRRAASRSPTARSSAPAAPPSPAPPSTARSSDTLVTDSADVAIHSFDARGAH